ncbi:MAG: 3-methyl-2-oxobutanoate hydroxymethyltransferase [Acidobacteriota bacterium]
MNIKKEQNITLPFKKKTVLDIKKKKAGEKISAITSYDFPTAKIASNAGIDLILVGDSLGMVLQGYENTLKVTLDHICYHTEMVSRANPSSLVVADMPFGSYHGNIDKGVENAIRLVKEGGAEAVKLEGGRKRFDIIRAIIDSEIPVLGHLGLTPQSINRFGGFKVQGKLKKKAGEILQDAIELEKLGVFAIVLESIPAELGKKITESLKIPTIGIGAGKSCDGQILVFHDLVGFTNLYMPKFVKKFADINSIMYKAVSDYKNEIESGKFPGKSESYFLNKNIDEFLK